MASHEELALDGEIISPRDTVRVIAYPHPLESRRLVLDLPAGSSIAEIVAEVRSDTRLPHVLTAVLGDGAGRDCAVIDQALWPRVRPKPGTVLALRATLREGAALRSVLGLAVTVAALIAAPYLAPGLITAAGALGITLSPTAAIAIVGGGIMVGGSLALNALFCAPAAQLLEVRSECRP